MKTSTKIMIQILLIFNRTDSSQTDVQSGRGLVSNEKPKTPLIGATGVITGIKK